MASVNGFIFQRLVRFFSNFWVFVSAYMIPLFGVASRLYMKNDSLKYNSDALCEKIVRNHGKQETEEGCTNSVFDDSVSETTEFSFKFKFPTYEEFVRTKRGSDDFVISEASTSVSKYEYKKGLSTFLQEPEPITFKVEEVKSNFVSSESSDIGNDDEYLPDEDFSYPILEKNYVQNKTYVVDGVIEEEINEKSEAVSFTSNEGEAFDEEYNLQVSDEKGSSSTDSSTTEFLSHADFGGTFELDNLIDSDDEKEGSSEEMSDSDESRGSYDFEGEYIDIMKELKLEDRTTVNDSESHESHSSYDFEGEDSDIVKEVRELEDHVTITDKLTSNFLSEKDFEEGSNDKPIKSADNTEFPKLKSLSTLEAGDTNKLETLWEHKDLIEQLKMELKKVRATGLPTILEESESPKIMEDLKPWKIDEKFQHENPMDELHKFYKSYRDRMRKLDIMTYQKMYAIGFLQLKDPVPSSSNKKTTVPDIASILSENLYQYKAKKLETDPMKKFINELQIDLELVYVGQMCLSWEVLHWQYGIALDLWESDPRGLHRYNEVAGEFQQFQVLVQRFIEDEPFQGPRVQNYIKQRCAHRNFLQVPVIREDVTNDRKKGKGIQRGDYSITSDMLVEIVEESIRLFWRFVRADNHCTRAKVKSQKGVLVDLQDPADSEILVELQKDLQKKAKKLKDQLRSSNCILKKFRKCQEDDSSDPVLFFFSQVDMKLVSRVLRMSKLTTEQLVWCQKKLSSVSFINRKIHVEPSFHPFPC